MLGIYLNNFETKFSSLHTIKNHAPLLIRREKFCFPKLNNSNTILFPKFKLTNHMLTNHLSTNFTCPILSGLHVREYHVLIDITKFHLNLPISLGTNPETLYGTI